MDLSKKIFIFKFYMAVEMYFLNTTKILTPNFMMPRFLRMTVLK